ncbi:MAG: hypothetical protein JEZ08_21595 [Clostridiales bacterium]|nr:hypothetical protein [Clostridiales bacterium]
MKQEDGFGTIEVVILLAILVGLALLFKNQITVFVENILNDIVSKDFSLGHFHAFY